MADDKTKALLTPKFRASFPSVFEKSSFENSAPRYSVVLADERARTKRWRAAFFMAVATIAAIVALIGFNTHAGAFDHGFSDLPLPHSDEMQWVESRKMPGTPPRKASCCGKGDMYYADV